MTTPVVASGICPRCGRVVSSGHSRPECDAFYDQTYRHNTDGAERLVFSAKAAVLDETITYIRDHGTADLLHWLNRRRDGYRTGAQS